MSIVLVLGSGPNVVAARNWDSSQIDHIVAINNAWAVRPDWTHLIYPDDFAPERRPVDVAPDQTIVTSETYVPAQNALGGFVYAGGTMAFTAGYWALHALNPTVIGFMGCDMTYAPTGGTHFYGTGTADPLRDDVTLRSLEAKSTRMRLMAAQQGCAMVNLSEDESRLTLPRATIATLAEAKPAPNPDVVAKALAAEQALEYFVPTGKYWKEEHRFDTAEIDRVDALWRLGDAR